MDYPLRSLLNETTWDPDFYQRLHVLCSTLKAQDPIRWMTQFSPYIAGFQHKFDAYPVRTAGVSAIKAYHNLLPLCWFDQQGSVPMLDPLLKARIKHLSLYGAREPYWKHSYNYLKYFPHLTHLVTAPTAPTHFSSYLDELTPQDIPPLTHVCLQNNSLIDSNLDLLEQIGFFKHIQFLNLSNNPDITRLPHMPTLQFLRIENTSIPPHYPLDHLERVQRDV